MTANILNNILNSKISIDDTLDWLTTENPHDVAILDIEQTDSTRVEFILYFLDYLRQQCQGVLRPPANDGSEVQRPFAGMHPKMSGSIALQDRNKPENVTGHELLNANTNIGSPIVITPTVNNMSSNHFNASASTAQNIIRGSPAQMQMIPGNLQYESPQSHSSPYRGMPPSHGSLSDWFNMQDRGTLLGQHLSAFTSRSQNTSSPIQMQAVPGVSQYESPQSHSSSRLEDSIVSNLSMTSAVPSNSASPQYTSQMTPTKPRTNQNNKSRKSFNNTKSPGQNASNGQKHKKTEPNRSMCLGDFIVFEKSNSKQKSKNNSANQSLEQSPGGLDITSEAQDSKVTQQKNSNSRRRIKPTKIVVNSSTEDQQPETFGVVSRPPTSNPTFLEAMSTVETNKVTSYEDERELLKLQRQKQPIAPSVIEVAPQEPAKIFIKPKDTTMVVPTLELVEYVNILDICAQLHGGLLIKNLVSNPMTELYFIVSLITTQYKVDSEIKGLQLQPDEKLADQAESLKQLKETMGCADLIDDSSEENIESVVKDANSAADESNVNKIQSTADEKQYFKTVHNCVYFATTALWNAKNILSVFDRPTLALLCENALVKTFHPSLHEFLNKLYEEKCLQSKTVSPYNYSRTLQSNVCFQVDTDNRDNFPSAFAFSTFRRQRDFFYEILKTWEDNHLQKNWSFPLKLGNKINTMLSMHSDAVNYYHLAALFKSQLLLSSIRIGQAEDSLNDDNFGVLKSLKHLNPEKLQQLQQRLVTPISSMGPVPPPSFPGVQEFYKEFLSASSDPKFTTILQDCFIQEIMELNDTQFTCSDIDVKESKADESTKQSYLLCISSLRLLAKFLGFLISLPYQSQHDTLESVTTQIALRSRILPPMDLRECLYQALAHKQLSLTIPWMVQYLAMLDSVSFRLPYYLNICKSLYCIYRDTQYSLHDETALLIAFSIGWFFELSNFPRDIYFNWMKSLKHQKDKLADDVTAYTCRKVMTISDDSNSNIHQNNIVVDKLNIIDDRALYICCPYLKELKLLLTSGNTSLNSNNANRHITPVSSKLSQASSATKTISLELQLEEAFFHGHPRSIRKTVDVIVERIVSSCVKFIRRSIIPPIKVKTFRTMKKSFDRSIDYASRMRDIVASVTAKIRDQCYEIIPGMCESKSKSSMESLLPDDVLPAVKEICVKIAVRLEIEQIYQWLDSYINNAMTSNTMISDFESSRIDDEDEQDDDGATIKVKKIETTDTDVPWATSVIKDVRYSMWELLANNGRWSILEEETIFNNVKKIHQSLTGSKSMMPIARRLLYQISVDYAIHLIALRPDLFTAKVEETFIEIWQTHSTNNDKSTDTLFSGLLSPRNINILMWSNGDAVWIKYGQFIQRILRHNLTNIDKFSEECVKLLRYEYSSKTLKLLSKCVTEAVSDYKSGGGEYPGHIRMLLDWIIETCGMIMINSSDPRRPEKEIRYRPAVVSSQAQPGDDMTPDYMNILGMIFSMCGLMMRLKWCAWVALYCSCISFANARVSDDTKQILSSFMLSISAVVMSYLQNPQPMTPPWASALQ